MRAPRHADALAGRRQPASVSGPGAEPDRLLHREPVEDEVPVRAAAGPEVRLGAPITVDDVVWSLNRLGQTGIGQFLLATVNVDPQKVATAVDSRHFAITAAGPAAILAQLLAIYNFAVLEKAAYLKGATKKDTVGPDLGHEPHGRAGPSRPSSNTSGVGRR